MPDLIGNEIKSETSEGRLEFFSPPILGSKRPDQDFQIEANGDIPVETIEIESSRRVNMVNNDALVFNNITENSADIPDDDLVVPDRR